MPSSLIRATFLAAGVLAAADLTPAFGAKAGAADTVTFLYEDYPPYTYLKDGKVSGTVADRVAAIAAEADVTVSWRPATFSRMLRSIANGKNGPPVCIAGYGTTPERAASSWVSKPFAMSSGSGIAVMRANLDKFDGLGSITEILTTPTISGAFLQGATYSDVQTPLIEAGRARHLFIGGDDNDLAMMVVRGRVDFAMINPDQVNYLKGTLPGGTELVALQPSGMRPPGTEHILCTRSLAEPIRARLNEAIDTVMPMPGDDAPERDTDQ